MNRYLRLACVAAISAYFLLYIKTYTEWHFIDSVNLIFHEAGHSIFFFFGMFVRIAAGSAFQVALPLFISIYFFYKGQKVSGAICLLWVGQNLLNVSVYAGDAMAMQLDLLGGDSVTHDWNYLLGTLGILRYTAAVAQTIFAAGFVTICTGAVMAVRCAWEY